MMNNSYVILLSVNGNANIIELLISFRVDASMRPPSCGYSSSEDFFLAD